MKKVLIAMCAMAAVMSCAKTEFAFEQSSEISFSPVSKYNTKAAVTNGTYAQDLNFYAWAYTKEDTPKAYFAEILFKPEATQPDDRPAGLTSYTGVTPQYWPNEKALQFAGVSESGNVAASIVEMTNSSTLVVTGFDQPLPNNTTLANDLMWFFDDNAGSGYSKANTKYVQPTMKHACSWIEINVELDDALVDYWTDVEVNSIVFESLLTTGTATLTATTANWSNQNTEETNISIFAGTEEIDAAPKKIETNENNTIVIPQAPTTLAVNFSYTAPAGGNVSETVSGIKLDYNGASPWVAGKKYIYTLTISADEIKIAPKSEGWDEDLNGDTAGNGQPDHIDVK